MGGARGVINAGIDELIAADMATAMALVGL
jgi:hypothetical protein